MVAAQAVLATPLLAALSRQIVADAEAHLGEQLRSLRLSAPRRALALIHDTRFSLVTAALCRLRFGRAISRRSAPCWWWAATSTGTPAP